MGHVHAETRVPLDCEPSFVRDYATRSLLQVIKLLNGKFIMHGIPCIFDVLSPNMAGIRNFAFLFFLMYFFFLLGASLTV